MEGGRQSASLRPVSVSPRDEFGERSFAFFMVAHDVFFLLAQSISRHIPTGYFFFSIFLVRRLNAHRVGQKRLTMRALLCGMNTSGLSFFRLRCSAVPLQAHLKKKAGTDTARTPSLTRVFFYRV